MWFKKKKVSEKVQDDRELISLNERSIEALIVLAKNREDLIKELRQLQEKLKYLTPSNDAKVSDYDKKIKALIEDLRILLVKADDEKELPPKVEGTIQQIRLMMADRNAKI